MLMSLPEALLGPVHNAPKKFENAAFFLWLGLPSTLKTVLQRNFSKTLFKPEEFVNATSFLYGGETFWKRRYSTENDGVTIIMRFIWPIFLQTQIQNGRWLLRFSFLWRSVDGKHSMRFQSDTSLFIFLQLRWTGPMFLITCFTFLLHCYETEHHNKL